MNRWESYGESGDPADVQWERLKPLAPVSNGGCGRWRDHRQVLNGGSAPDFVAIFLSPLHVRGFSGTEACSVGVPGRFRCVSWAYPWIRQERGSGLPGCAGLSLGGGAHDDVTYIDTVRLLDGEGDGAGHRIRRKSDLHHLVDLVLHSRVHALCEVRADGAG